jgi:predicted ester cyclase
LLACKRSGYQPKCRFALEGIEVFKRFFSMTRAAFPKLDYEIKEPIAEGSLVVVHWTAKGAHEGAFLGVAPTMKQVQPTGVEILRLADRKCVEHWGDWGASELQRQVSVVPPPASAAVEAARIGVEAAKVRVEEARATAEAARTGSVEVAKIRVEGAKELVEKAKVGVETKKAETETAKVSLETRKVHLEEGRLTIAGAQEKTWLRLLLQGTALLLAFFLALRLADIGRGIAAAESNAAAFPYGWVVAIVALAAPLAFTVLVAAGAASFRSATGSVTPVSGAAPATSGAPTGAAGPRRPADLRRPERRRRPGASGHRRPGRRRRFRQAHCPLRASRPCTPSSRWRRWTPSCCSVWKGTRAIPL